MISLAVPGMVVTLGEVAGVPYWLASERSEAMVDDRDASDDTLDSGGMVDGVALDAGDLDDAG